MGKKALVILLIITLLVSLFPADIFAAGGEESTEIPQPTEAVQPSVSPEPTSEPSSEPTPIIMPEATPEPTPRPAPEPMTEPASKPLGIQEAIADDAGETTLDISLGSITISATGANGGGISESVLNPAGYIIVMSSGTSTTNAITVTASTAVTLSGVCIDVSGTENACAFSMESGATVNLTLANMNALKSGKDKAGLQVISGTTVVICGAGSLTATGGYRSSGIGGGFSKACGNITISGGNVTAAGGEAGAGIGGSCDHSGGTITIEGTTEVAATGGSGGAGIGGGSLLGSGGTITIKDNAKVVATGGNDGAGIGGGRSGSGGNITISGGTVTAQGGENGAGIGGGDCGNGGTISIKGSADLTATGGENGAGIGGGNLQTGGSISISSGEVTAQGGTEGSGIGGGYSAAGGFITISGGDVSATGGFWGAAVGGGYYGKGGNIAVSGGTLTAVGGQCGAGIGGGYGGDSGTIVIEGNAEIMASGGTGTAAGSGGAAGIGGGAGRYWDRLGGNGETITIGGNTEVTAVGGKWGAGIGGGYFGDGGNITINNGVVVATGGEIGAGIGGGAIGDNGSVTISGGKVTTMGGEYAPGIGSGGDSGSSGGAGGTIMIEGTAEVVATGGRSRAGIGGGNAGDCGTITIKDSAIVSATGGNFGAGIGGGYYASTGNITISSGSVNATGGKRGAGIGGGYLGTGTGNVGISGGSVIASGGSGGAGIGGGRDGSVDTISIAGGIIYAEMGIGAQYDIGDGLNGSGGTISISGDSAVLIKNNLCATPLTTTHALYSTDIQTNGKVFEKIDVPTGWEGNTIYAYLNTSEVSTLTFDANGGTGTVPEQRVQYNGTTAILPDGNGLIKNRLHLLNWNTQADGLGTDYAVGDTYAFISNNLLYAQYEDPVHVGSINLSSHEKTIGLGETLTLTANVLPEDATYPEVTWSSNNTGVATVSQSGVVTALYPGTVTITVTADSKSDTCDITVVPKKYSISVAPNNSAYGTVSGGGVYSDGVSVTVKAAPNAGYQFVRWIEDDIEVSTYADYSFPVTGGRTLIAVFEQDVPPPTIIPVGISCSIMNATLYGAKGTVTVTASGGNSGAYQYSLDSGSNWQDSNTFSVAAGTYAAVARDALNTGNTATCSITVGQPAFVGAVPAKKVSSQAAVDTAITVMPPAAPKGYTTQSIAFATSNPSVATVDANGNVTFLAGGKVTIITKVVSQMTDSRGRVRTKITTVRKTVSVKQPVSSITLNLYNKTIARTQKVKLVVSLSPSTASNKKVTWKSNNPKVAAVSSSGVVTGKAGGTAIITCTARDGSGVSASCIVTVTPVYPTGIKISKTVFQIKPGKTLSLRATISPRNTDFKIVIWTSSNPSIATVDAKGRIRGISPGTVTITATTSNGLSTSCTVTVQ